MIIDYRTRDYILSSYPSFFYSLDFCLPNHCRCRGIVAPDHTQWNTHIWLNSSEGGVGRSQRPLFDNTQHLQGQTSMPPSGFESIIPASERPQTHALDRAATGIGFLQNFVTYFLCLRHRDSLNPVVPKACYTDPKGCATVPRGCLDTVLQWILRSLLFIFL